LKVKNVNWAEKIPTKKLDRSKKMATQESTSISQNFASFKKKEVNTSTVNKAPCVGINIQLGKISK